MAKKERDLQVTKIRRKNGKSNRRRRKRRTGNDIKMIDMCQLRKDVHADM
jgi:hypothetical protein